MTIMIVTIDELKNIRTKHKNQKIVLTSGTFDLFHVGHLNYLNQVKTYGDIIVVLLSGDARVRRRKSQDRPIIPEDDRAKILDALKVIDYVFIDPAKSDPSETDPIHTEIIARLQPDLYVTDGPDPRFLKLLGPKLVVLSRTEVGKYKSTSAIINRVQGKQT